MHLQQGESLSFESWCVEHPSEADDLRRLHGQYEQWRSIFERLSSSAGDAAGEKRLADELREQYGEGVDPGISLDGDRPADDFGPSSDLLRRLRTHAPSNSRYQLLSEVGRGGMGAVIRVWDGDLRRTLAMKVVLGKEDKSAKGATPPVDSRTLGRFLEEAQITGQLDHPGIVPVHELGLGSDGEVYFTMRLVKGEDLRAIYGHVESGHEDWTTTRALSVMLKVCEAMAYAHSKGVIHRDLKPDNIMVGKYGEVYVMDWGLARVAGQKDLHDLRLRGEPQPGTSQSVRTERREERVESPDSALVTMDGDVMGTPAYMPPEQARGELAQLGPHSDVYAVGAMLYHLLLVRHIEMPYVAKGARMSQHRVLMLAQEGAPTPLFQFDKTIPAPLVAIVEKAMSRDIARRYADMEALSKDLRAYIEGRVVQAYETGTWAETKQWVKRNKPLAASIAAGVLVLVGGIALVLQQSARANQNAVRAQENAEVAQRNAETAERNATTAQLARNEATQKANDVLSLSAQKDHDDLVAEAASLWPAHPEKIPAYEDWLRRANELVDGRAADEARGVKKRPSLAEHKAKLAELRRAAKPLSEAEILAERESHPRHAELQTKQAELLWRSRMLGVETWPSDASVEAELAKELLPEDADALNSLARPLVDPAKPDYGQEVRALLLARRAVAAASEEKRSAIRDTLAWALFKLGRFDEALSETRTALSEPSGEILKSSAADLEQAVAAWRGDELTKRREVRDNLAEEVAALTTLVNERRTYEFDDPEQEWWNRSLSKLVGDLEKLRDPRTGLMNDVFAEPFGWGVSKRYEFAKMIGDRSVTGPEAKRMWDEAISAIRSSPKYGGLELAPQMGLLPIGMDPASQLWEFAHVQTGAPAVRGVDGQLMLSEETGLVFVLIPGGKFWMGAQNKPGAQNHDPQAESHEGPVHEVDLSPYFLSKYEMTQGQWQRIANVNPSGFRPPSSLAPSLLHPVEQVSWQDCFDLLEDLGLSLPSEAQWEHGARGGTSTRWWTGQEFESLRGKVNVADKSFVAGGGSNANIADMPDLDDGSIAHAAVGSYAANGFGLHEVAGNIAEWCLDAFDHGSYLRMTGKDPVTPSSGIITRVLRGGCWWISPAAAGSATRLGDALGRIYSGFGLRPARRITP
jgi:serine/threonine protein kinase/formylglycine-generating enzyme required for sulfatase activity